MRLSKQEVDKIINSLSLFLGNNSAELYLFGSRVNDNLKGGDIDLLLVLEKESIVSELISEKYKILAKIKEFIGDQRIDLKIASRQELKTDSFLKVIFPEAKLLYRWDDK